MKTLSITVLSLLITVSYSLASDSTEVEGLGVLASFFIGFGILIVLYQFIPGLMQICGLLKEIFPSIDAKVTDVSSK